MPTELDRYLDSLGLENEDRNQLATILGKAGDKATAPILMRDDYTRKTQELSRERERIAAETTELNRQLSKALGDLESGRTTQAQYEARLARIQDEYGIDQSDILAKKAAAPQEPAKPTVDPTILARLEAAEKNYGISPRIAAVLADTQLEYQRVFGSLEGYSATKLMDHAEANKRTLTDAFNELYKVPEKKHELLVADIRKKAEEEADAKFQQRMDAALAGNATGERNPNSWNQNGSHLLSDKFKGNIANRISERATEAGHAPPSQTRTAAQGELEGGAARFAKAFLERRAKGVAFGQDAA